MVVYLPNINVNEHTCQRTKFNEYYSHGGEKLLVLLEEGTAVDFHFNIFIVVYLILLVLDEGIVIYLIFFVFIHFILLGERIVVDFNILRLYLFHSSR